MFIQLWCSRWSSTCGAMIMFKLSWCSNIMLKTAKTSCRSIVVADTFLHFVVWVIVPPRDIGQCQYHHSSTSVPLKHWYALMGVHCIATQRTVIWSYTAMKNLETYTYYIHYSVINMKILGSFGNYKITSRTILILNSPTGWPTWN